VSGAKELLGLTEEELAYVELKIALGQRLKQRRKARRMTQEELAEQLKSSQSRVAKMEAGDPTVSIDLLVRSLFALGATRKDLARAVAQPTNAVAT
jgi:transcriptional regulator with XRE-family HTH domain